MSRLSPQKQQEKYINLSTCTGKYTYINFFATWNHNSLKEMEVINQLQNDYPFINFISINLNQKKNDFLKYLEHNENYKWFICQPINRGDN